MAGLGDLAQGLVGGLKVGREFENDDLKRELFALQSRAAKLDELKNLIALSDAAPESVGLFKDQVAPEHQGLYQSIADRGARTRATTAQLYGGLLTGKPVDIDPTQMGDLSRDKGFVAMLPDLIKNLRTRQGADAANRFAQSFVQQYNEARNRGDIVDDRELALGIIAKMDPTDARALAENGWDKALGALKIEPLSMENRDAAVARKKVREFFAGDLPRDYTEALRTLAPYLDSGKMKLETLDQFYPQHRAYIEGLKAQSTAMGKGLGEAKVLQAPVESDLGPSGFLPGRSDLQLGRSPAGQIAGFDKPRTIGDLRASQEGAEALAKETPTTRGLNESRTRYFDAAAKNLEETKPTDVTVASRELVNTFVTQGRARDPQTGTMLVITNPADVQRVSLIANMDRNKLSQLATLRGQATIVPKRAAVNHAPADAITEARRLFNAHRGREIMTGLDSNNNPIMTKPTDEQLMDLISASMEQAGWRPR